MILIIHFSREVFDRPNTSLTINNVSNKDNCLGYNLSLPQCSSITIYKCSIYQCCHLQVSQFSSVTICKCCNFQVSQFTNVTIYKCDNLQMSQFTSVIIYKCHNLQVFRISGTYEMRTTEYGKILYFNDIK